MKWHELLAAFILSFCFIASVFLLCRDAYQQGLRDGAEKCEVSVKT